MRRLGTRLILLLAALIVAHAQCVLTCAVDDCRQASMPPCHRHHPTKSISGCNQDQFVAVAHPTVPASAPWAAATIAPAEPSPLLAFSRQALMAPVSPPGAFVRSLHPIRI